MSWHFDVIRGVGMAVAGAVMSGAFYWAGYMRGRREEQRRFDAILEALGEQGKLIVERMRDLRKFDLDRVRRGLLDRVGR